MIDLTAKANVNGVKFDGIDVFLPRRTWTSIRPMMTLKKLAEKVQHKQFHHRFNVVAKPVWAPLLRRLGDGRR